MALELDPSKSLAVPGVSEGNSVRSAKPTGVGPVGLEPTTNGLKAPSDDVADQEKPPETQ